MVQTDISQLSTECSDWLNNLRNYREEFHNSQKKLQQISTDHLSKDQLKEVDHFDNQFEIQLNNIHHLKQAIKAHGRTIIDGNADAIVEDNLAYHEDLFDRYTSLDNMLQDLRSDFQQFINRQG